MSVLFVHLGLDFDRDIVRYHRRRVGHSEIGALDRRNGADPESLLLAHRLHAGEIKRYVERYGLRHALDGKIARHLAGLVAGPLEFRALEGDFGEILHVEQFLAAHVLVEHRDKRFDTAGYKGNVYGAVLGSLRHKEARPGI